MSGEDEAVSPRPSHRTDRHLESGHPERKRKRKTEEQAGDLSIPFDKRVVGTGLPRHKSARERGGAHRRAAVWSQNDVFSGDEVLHGKRSEDTEIWGIYPKGFLNFALRVMQVPAAEVLHVCSGSLTKRDVQGGTRVDINPARKPDVVADGRHLPFKDNTFGGVMIDPPYTLEYARDLYQCEYPRPRHLLIEATRVVKPGGMIAFLHFILPHVVPGMRFVGVRGVSQGLGYRIRALSLYRKVQDGLPLEHGPGVESGT